MTEMVQIQFLGFYPVSTWQSYWVLRTLLAGTLTLQVLLKCGCGELAVCDVPQSRYWLLLG